MPTMRTNAVRTPATITGSASGSSIRNSVDHADMPMPTRRLDQARIDAVQARDGVGDDGQGAVHGERDDGADRSDAEQHGPSAINPIAGAAWPNPATVMIGFE